ncbi:MAG: HAD hydrolase-like protein [Clostridia bacterium]|nr:HAD hydrolase-like protein [Clostridia bacterium]
MKYKTLLFDLDGTVIDSFEGVINSVKYSLNKLNAPIPDSEKLKKYVGPPLTESYMKFNGFDRKKAEDAIEIYREYYTEKGIYETRLYDGMYSLLEDLHKAGYEIILATSKPEKYAVKILENLCILKFFSKVCGCPMKEAGVTKIDIMNLAIKNAKTKNKSEIIMIGDTTYDINGAEYFKIDSVGVLYGAGSAEELSDATYIANDVNDLRKIFLN